MEEKEKKRVSITEVKGGNISTRREGSIVSKAAETSNRMRAEKWPLILAVRSLLEIWGE